VAAPIGRLWVAALLAAATWALVALALVVAVIGAATLVILSSPDAIMTLFKGNPWLIA
jgi:hypothetical protein